MDKLLEKDVAKVSTHEHRTLPSLIVPKGKIKSEEAKEARDRVTIVPADKGIAGFRDADMVVEVYGSSLLLAQLLERVTMNVGCIGESCFEANYIPELLCGTFSGNYTSHQYILNQYHKNCCGYYTRGSERLQ